ncbi:2-hydroxy-3-oxopropionate reductase [Tessaracoccus sp. MC1865]|uniref:2-hydroxy-3-oxopropionate reductase n=1 Tax=unclassified Tessaracoccus TaxID=2635419 RepID=UPI001601BB35|nr:MULTISPECIES: 2-hydroxy-3-oxopropionate reductase [unclassified Tessaracoccus]MBB1483918.1 2-hydroxy-3-oxopropionate reductase [Tessaracoccus sp. MC1865]MBB1508572.1 2-hydroxy-3-oxopropionate reductase [Tessaracoccus sp. MC1756]QTO36969.1 2-hydroxy-3-oxopropionate reductase [Tessaracoccus sp. MC1865]
MTNIAFIGLGIMGLPMARNLVKAGHTVVAFNRSPGKVQQFAAEGGRGATSVAEAVKDADVIITMVPDSPDVEAVVTGDEGVFANAKRGAIWIDTSTIRPDVAQRLAQQATEAGIRAIDAPVSGGEAGAVEGNLSIMVGGDAGVVEEARPVLEDVGTTIVHVGPAGSGQTVKAANQLIVAGTIQLVAESLVFLEAHGVDLEAAVQVLAGGLAGNRILDRKAASMIKGEFAPGFRIDLHHKDLGIVTSAAREAGVILPVGTIVAQLMNSARQRGYGSLDHSALLKLAQDLAGKS